MLVGNELVVLAAQILLDYSSLVASIQRKLVLLNIKKKKKTCTDRLFPKMGECREVLGGGPAPPSKL